MPSAPRTLFALAFAFASFTATTLAKPPNVLLLVADDLNSWPLGDRGRYPGEVVTPNLDRLAASGVSFVHAYTASPVCSPSRTAFFSGVSPWRSGHYHNALQVGESQALGDALSLAGAFKQAGYTTAGYGKITHGWDQKQHWDEKVGHKRDPAPPGAPLTPVGRGEQDWGPIHLDEADMNGTQLADAAIARLGATHDRPFFVAFGLFNPHMPWYVPQKYFDRFPLEDVATPPLKPGDLDDVPPLARALTSGKGKFVEQVLAHGLHRHAVQAYLATTAYADAQIGRVLDALDTGPHKDDTVVVFITDHGFHLGEKGHWQKATLWEEATHCLLTVRAPGLTTAGGNCERFVSLQDLYPTLAELCGLEPRADLDGRSLVPLLKDPASPWQSTALTALCDKTAPEGAYITVRNEQGRYTRYASGQEEFYDTTVDPREWTNQIDNPAYADTVSSLRASVPPPSAMARPLPPVRRRR